LSKSKDRGAVWRLVGNQIIFSRIWSKTSINTDQWDVWCHSFSHLRTECSWRWLEQKGYTANRNRTLSHLYNNKISNTIFLSGDSHANWVSDLVWLGTKPYNKETGEGAIGVEFAGTSVTSGKPGGSIEASNKKSAKLVKNNPELQWSELYYRGYYELHVSPKEIIAQYFGGFFLAFVLFLVTSWKEQANALVGCPTVRTRNPLEISLANFTVKAGENRLQRKVAGGIVENGALQKGEVKQTNLTLNTETRSWSVTKGLEPMLIAY